ncbi:aminotransferase class V-fold PLP-dependent enzyme [Aliiglaciecola sp.]|nr:aminotransferase class V-fold PLP-dependent enzyme [Aliiglaciecola sp.]
MSVNGLFHVPEKPYFLSHSVGCLPTSSESKLAENFLAPWKSSGGDAWGPWLGLIDDFCHGIGGLLGVKGKDICPQTNLSSSFTKFLMSIPKIQPKRNKVLMDKHAFPSMGFVAKALGEMGFELQLVDTNNSETEVQAWQSNIDAATLCVLITHVHSNTGYVSDITKIANLARENGAYSVVDIAQSVGILPINVQSWNASCVIGSCVKWLCGGPGAGFMWIEPTIVDSLCPVDVGWFSHQDPFEMDITHFQYADGVKRFWGGTPSVVPYVFANNGIRTIEHIGIDNIHAHNRELLQPVLQAFENQLITPIDLNKNGGTLCLKMHQMALSKICSKLDAGGAYYDTRGDTIRLSMHIYNDEKDLDLLIS